MRTPAVMPMMPQKIEAIMKARTDLSSYLMVVVMVRKEGGGMAYPGLGSRLGFGFRWGRRGYSGFEVKWQEGIPLGAGTPAAPDFHREAHDKQPGKAGRGEDGKGEYVHGREDEDNNIRISSPEFGKRRFFPSLRPNRGRSLALVPKCLPPPDLRKPGFPARIISAGDGIRQNTGGLARCPARKRRNPAFRDP